MLFRLQLNFRHRQIQSRSTFAGRITHCSPLPIGRPGIIERLHRLASRTQSTTFDRRASLPLIPLSSTIDPPLSRLFTHLERHSYSRAVTSTLQSISSRINV